MRLEGCELRRVRLELVAPFESSSGAMTWRDALLLRLVAVGAGGERVEGWGECVAMGEPRYSPEYVDGAVDVLCRFLLPALARGAGPAPYPEGGPAGPGGGPAGPGGGSAAPGLRAGEVARLLGPFKGHPMAKSAVEMGVLDAELRLAGMSFASYLGAVRSRVPVGVSVGIMASLGELLDAVAGYVDAGYLRVKLKIRQGWDVEVVSAVRGRWCNLMLQVDANGAYTPGDAAHLRRLDGLGLALIEQPFAHDDLAGHAMLARTMSTPVCLDESITSATAARHAIELGACSVVNLKPGRVGGYLEARRVHDVCVAAGAGLWCGGMFETGLGRAANVALAAMPGFSLPGDISASGRYFVDDIVAPFVLDAGHLEVPSGPGLGVEVRGDVLDSLTYWREWVPLAPPRRTV